MAKHIGYLTRATLALILAGGKGRRLKALTEKRAKPSLPFAGKYKIVDFTISNCMNSGIRRIDVLTQYESYELLEHIQKAWSRMPWELGEFVNILPAQQSISTNVGYSGTADAVYQNLQLMDKQGCEYVLVLGGDHIYKMDYSCMLQNHVKHHANISVACIPVDSKEATDFGVLSVDEQMCVDDFVEKPQTPPELPDEPGKSLVSMGVYIFNFETLKALLVADAEEHNSKHDFGFNIIPRAIKEYKVLAYPFTSNCCADVQAYWKDVGTVDQYFQANLDLVKIEPDLNLYDKDWPIYSCQDQLPGAKFVFDQDGGRGQAIDSVITAGCIISGASIKNSLLSNSVRVEKHSYVNQCVVLPNVSIGRCCQLYNVLVMEGCNIPDGFCIGFDFNMDKKYYHISENGVRLVNQSMIDCFVETEHRP